MPRVVAAIFARGGSKGIPRKNLQILGGRSLLAHAIDAARRTRLVDRVVVSTDDHELADAARAAGAEVPFIRPAELATDSAPEWLAWQHLVTELQSQSGAEPIDVLLSVPPTSPLRSVDDLDRCVTTLLESDADIVVTVRPAERSPYFNMVVLDETRRATLVIPPATAVLRRQEAPEVFDMTTVGYAARPEFVLRAQSLFAGTVRAVVVPAERAIDIDTPFDLLTARLLWANGHANE